MAGLREAFFGSKPLQKMIGEGDDVLRPLSQRRNLQVKLAQSMVEVTAECARLDELLQRLIGGGNHLDIDIDLAIAAQPVVRCAVQNAQQLDLQFGVELTDLIQQDRAPVGQLEQPFFAALGAAEGALLISEKLAFEQVFRDGRAIDGHPLPARGVGNAGAPRGQSIPCRFRFLR